MSNPKRRQHRKILRQVELKAYRKKVLNDLQRLKDWFEFQRITQEEYKKKKKRLTKEQFRKWLTR